MNEDPELEKTLRKRVWDYHDVMRFFGCGKWKAYQIIKLAKERHHGATELGENLVTADSVLAIINSNLRNERGIHRRIKNSDYE